MATFVVAAYNSLETEGADFICDGVDDQVEINTAIDSLPAGGGSIYLMEGTFILGGNITISQSNVCLLGTGAATVLQIEDGTNADINVISASGQENLLLKDLRINGNRANQTGGTMYGIYFNGVENSKIVDCWVENLTSTGIFLEASSSNIITGNTCQENGYCGILLYNSSNNNTVTGNTCGGNGQFGILLQTSSNNTVTGNTCGENGFDGILLETSSNNTVTGNTCEGNGFNGIFLSESSNYNTITGNTCGGNGENGIILWSSCHNVVSSNIVEGNGQHGIILEYESNHNVVSSNIVEGNGGNGIYLYSSCYSNIVSVNMVENNSKDGILLYADCGYNYIGGNMVRAGPPASPIQQYGVVILDFTCDCNLVINNDLFLAGVLADYVDNGTNTIFDANRLTPCQTWVD